LDVSGEPVASTLTVYSETEDNRNFGCYTCRKWRPDLHLLDRRNSSLHDHDGKTQCPFTSRISSRI